MIYFMQSNIIFIDKNKLKKIKKNYVYIKQF